MWPFRSREKTDADNVPTEVQDYYQVERRERVGMAWLLAFVSLIVTVLIAFGLFFSGRWVYRKIAHKDKSSTTNTAQQGSGQTQDLQGMTTSPSSNGSGTSNTPTSNTSSTSTSTPSASTTTTTSNQTSTSNSTLLRTGPEGDD